MERQNKIQTVLRLYFKFISEKLPLYISLGTPFWRAVSSNVNHLSPDITELEITHQNLPSIISVDPRIFQNYFCAQPEAVPLKHTEVTD